jgi:hypothetical protein
VERISKKVGSVTSGKAQSAERPGKGLIHAVDSDVFQEPEDVKEFEAMIEKAERAEKKNENARA